MLFQLKYGKYVVHVELYCTCQRLWPGLSNMADLCLCFVFRGSYRKKMALDMISAVMSSHFLFLYSRSDQPEIMPSPYYPFVSLTGRGHDTFLCWITCKKSQNLDFSLIGQETIQMICAVPIGQNAAICQLLLISVSIFACVMSSEYTRKFIIKLLLAQFS